MIRVVFYVPRSHVSLKTWHSFPIPENEYKFYDPNLTRELFNRKYIHLKLCCYAVSKYYT